METEIPILDFAKMTKMQKLAALLIILGPESAAQMLKNFDEHELEAISLEMSKLTVISQDSFTTGSLKRSAMAFLAAHALTISADKVDVNLGEARGPQSVDNRSRIANPAERQRRRNVVGVVMCCHLRVQGTVGDQRPARGQDAAPFGEAGPRGAAGRSAESKKRSRRISD